MMNITKRGGLLVFIIFSICTVTLHAKPRPPMPPLPEFTPVLWHEGFDGPYYYRSTNAEVIVPDVGRFVESWSGYALQRAGSSVPRFILPAVTESPACTNISCGLGAVRFWIKPYWSSSTLANAGGPGNYASLIDLI